jgi:histidinol-phosphatase (PHP family)
LRDRYHDRIEVRVGLEVDLLPGGDDHLRAMLDRHVSVLDEIVCSIHLLPDGAGGWGSLDLSPESFTDLARRLGSVAALRRLYFETLAEQLERNVCAPLPRRVGHLLLPDKFRRLHPQKARGEAALVARVVDVAAAKGYGLDLNSAGLRQPHCGAFYLRGAPLAQALRLRVPVVFGSDAHRPADVGSGWAEAGTEIGRVG